MTALGFGIPGVGQSCSAVFAAAPHAVLAVGGRLLRAPCRPGPSVAFTCLVRILLRGADGAVRMSGRRGHPRRSHVRPPGLRAILTIESSWLYFPAAALTTNSEPQAYHGHQLEVGS